MLVHPISLPKPPQLIALAYEARLQFALHHGGDGNCVGEGGCGGVEPGDVGACRHGIGIVALVEDAVDGAHDVIHRVMRRRKRQLPRFETHWRSPTSSASRSPACW